MYKKSHKGENNPMYGKHHSKKTKRNMKVIHKGKHYSPSTEFKKGHKMSETTKQNLRKSLMGRVSPMKDKNLSKRHKERISDALKGNHPVNEFKEGHKHSKKIKEKIGKANSIALKGRRLFEKHKENIRKGLIHYVEEVRLNGEILYPCIGKHENKILDSLEKEYNTKILRQHRIAGYFLDGYSPGLNIAFEVDELYKHKNNIQKDIERENIIKNKLNCDFIRIKIGD